MKMSELFLLVKTLRPKIEKVNMSIKTTYKFSRFFKELEEHIKFFDDTLTNLIKEYGKKDANGEYVLTENNQGVIIQEDKYDECMKKVQELNDLEPNLVYIPSFTLDELEDLNLSVEELNLLLPFIDEE